MAIDLVELEFHELQLYINIRHMLHDIKKKTLYIYKYGGDDDVGDCDVYIFYKSFQLVLMLYVLQALLILQGEPILYTKFVLLPNPTIIHINTFLINFRIKHTKLRMYKPFKI